SLPPLPPSPAQPCLPCLEGRKRAAPHSSLFPPTTAPLQTLHLDVWGPARVNGQGREFYFQVLVDDYTRYTTVFPLCSKGERFGQDLRVMRLHSDRGGEFSSDLLQEFCHGEGILSSVTLPASPQQNGVAERRIGLVMEVAHTSMIHAAAPHFLWPFAVRYAVHQLNLWPRVSLPETLPTLRWTGEVGDASVFRFYHPTLRHVFPSQDVMFDEPVPFYHLFPYRSATPVDPLPPQGPAPSSVSQVDPLPSTMPAEVAGDSGPAGASPRLSPWPEPLSPQQLRDTAGAGGTGGAAAAGSGGARTRGTGAARTGHVGGAGAGDPTEPGAAEFGGVGAGGPGAGDAGAGGAGAGGPGAGGAGAGGAGVVDPGAGGVGVGGASGTGAGGTMRPRLYFVPLLQQPTSPLPAPSPYSEQTGGLTERRELASRPPSIDHAGRRVPRLRPPLVPGTHAMALRPSSVPQRVPLPAPPESSLSAVPHPESDRARAASPTFSRLLAIVVTDPFFESAAASSLVAELLDFAAACRPDYATALIAESESASPPSVGGECALGTDVLEDRQEDFECLAAAAPRFASMLLASEGDPDAPDILTPRSYAEAITGLYSSQW
ncbi:unnamed protein product, partial [Closterium sp. NIES-54]